MSCSDALFLTSFFGPLHSIWLNVHVFTLAAIMRSNFRCYTFCVYVEHLYPGHLVHTFRSHSLQLNRSFVFSYSRIKKQACLYNYTTRAAKRLYFGMSFITQPPGGHYSPTSIMGNSFPQCRVFLHGFLACDELPCYILTSSFLKPWVTISEAWNLTHSSRHRHVRSGQPHSICLPPVTNIAQILLRAKNDPPVTINEYSLGQEDNKSRPRGPFLVNTCVLYPVSYRTTRRVHVETCVLQRTAYRITHHVLVDSDAKRNLRG